MAETQPQVPLKDRSLSWLKEQHARHVVIEKEGRVALDVPLTVFVVGAIIAPHAAVLGIVVALVTRHEVRVTRPAPPAAEGHHEPLPGGEFPVGEEAADPNDGDQTWPA